MPLAGAQAALGQAMNKVVREQDIAWWRESFMADLDPEGTVAETDRLARGQGGRGDDGVVALKR